MRKNTLAVFSYHSSLITHHSFNPCARGEGRGEDRARVAAAVASVGAQLAVVVVKLAAVALEFAAVCAKLGARGAFAPVLSKLARVVTEVSGVGAPLAPVVAGFVLVGLKLAPVCAKLPALAPVNVPVPVRLRGRDGRAGEQRRERRAPEKLLSHL
jgi:hypothetical protein